SETLHNSGSQQSNGATACWKLRCPSPPQTRACARGAPGALFDNLDGWRCPAAIKDRRRVTLGHYRCMMRLNLPFDAGSRFASLSGPGDWFCENHPHSGLGMRSPKEFIRAQSPSPAVRYKGGLLQDV